MTAEAEALTVLDGFGLVLAHHIVTSLGTNAETPQSHTLGCNFSKSGYAWRVCSLFEEARRPPPADDSCLLDACHGS